MVHRHIGPVTYALDTIGYKLKKEYKITKTYSSIHRLQGLYKTGKGGYLHSKLEINVPYSNDFNKKRKKYHSVAFSAWIGILKGVRSLSHMGQKECELCGRLCTMFEVVLCDICKQINIFIPTSISKCQFDRFSEDNHLISL